MKIALTQINYIVGDIRGNLERIREKIMHASMNDTDLVLFSELAICGYPPLDLLERETFVKEAIAAIHQLATEIPSEIGVILGGPEINSNPEGKLLFNSAYFITGGKVQGTVRKSLLPTYDIFDEYRYFEPNRAFDIVEFKGKKLAITICEDLWDDQPMEKRFSRNRLYTRHPLEEMVKFSPDLVINIAASPFSSKRQKIKEEIFVNKARKHRLPVVMVNQVGANTELIFEGSSLVVAPDGSIHHRMDMFREDYYECELEDIGTHLEDVEEQLPERISMIHQALVMGIRDYFTKSGFIKATLGLSGGIDSAVTLALAAEALGSENIEVLLMPSQYSSDHSVSDAAQMAETLQIEYETIAIKDIFNLFREALDPVFGDTTEDITEENIQSRIRGTLLMALSNKKGHILLNTSNKSETAVGYGTLYGDMAGGLSVLGDVYKVDVFSLARYLNRKDEIIPENIITKPPSAELRPDQKDTDSLPPYEILDQILELYIEKQYPVVEISEQGFDPELVKRIIRMVDRNEYKRYQTPPILRITSKSFGVGRKLPIVGRY